MTGLELQAQIKRITNDTTEAWSPTQYMEAINAAIVYVCQARIAGNDAEFTTPVTVTNGYDQPADFVRFSGSVPIEIRDLGTVRKWYFAGTTNPTVKYYRMRPMLTALTETVQLSYRHLEAAKLAAAIYLKEQRGTFDMSGEKERLAAMLA